MPRDRRIAREAVGVVADSALAPRRMGRFRIYSRVRSLVTLGCYLTFTLQH